MCAGPQNATIGITSTLLAAANDRRTGLFIRNLSANNICIGFDHPAEINKGFVLLPNEWYSMGPNDTSVADVYVIASGADSLVSFQEFSCRSVDQ